MPLMLKTWGTRQWRRGGIDITHSSTDLKSFQITFFLTVRSPFFPTGFANLKPLEVEDCLADSPQREDRFLELGCTWQFWQHNQLDLSWFVWNLKVRPQDKEAMKLVIPLVKRCSILGNELHPAVWATARLWVVQSFPTMTVALTTVSPQKSSDFKAPDRSCCLLVLDVLVLHWGVPYCFLTEDALLAAQEARSLHLSECILILCSHKMSRRKLTEVFFLLFQTVSQWLSYSCFRDIELAFGGFHNFVVTDAIVCRCCGFCGCCGGACVHGCMRGCAGVTGAVRARSHE